VGQSVQKVARRLSFIKGRFQWGLKKKDKRGIVLERGMSWDFLLGETKDLCAVNTAVPQSIMGFVGRIYRVLSAS
jgi:hypothetical protein